MTRSTDGTAGVAAGRLAHHLAVKAVVAAAAGVGLTLGGGSAAWAGLQRQARLASERIGMVKVPPPLRDGVYFPDGHHQPTPSPGTRPLRLAMLGDSTSAGFGAADEDSLPGVMLCRTLAAELGRPVQLFTHAVVGTGAADLARQRDEAVLDEPDLVVIIVGPNDVRDRISPVESVRELSDTVVDLRAQGIAVVVATCPDLGVVAPIPQPLRQLAGHWSRSLANRQERAVVRAGGVTVPIGRLVSPGFVGHPELFAPDLFHPSGAGYALAVALLVPASFRALGLPPPGGHLVPSMQAEAQLFG